MELESALCSVCGKKPFVEVVWLSKDMQKLVCEDCIEVVVHEAKQEDR